MTRALELDPDLAEARAALGLVRFYFEWDWAGADAEFRRALALNPEPRRTRGLRALSDAMGRLDEGSPRAASRHSRSPLGRPSP